MPELPEVETVRRGLSPRLVGRTIKRVTMRRPDLRWPIPVDLPELLQGSQLDRIDRRGKFLQFRWDDGTMLVHLGMSGVLRIVDSGTHPTAHDHVDWLFDDGQVLRLNDPRRFGAVLWHDDPASAHRLLARLGPEPFSDDFSANYLHDRARGKRVAIKSFIMNSSIVVGVGNIYASESLYMSGIRPTTPAGRISRARMQRLTEAVVKVLERAIEAGGTTLKDFVGSDGQPGYFSQSLSVYDREGKPCKTCSRPIERMVIGQRATFFCRRCQR